MRGYIFTDVDNTWFRRDRAMASWHLWQEACRRGFFVGAVTGVFFQAMLKRIQRGELPFFHAVCSSVGTEIWKFQKGGYVLDEGLRNLEPFKTYNREEIVSRGRKLVCKCYPWRFDFQQGQPVERFKVSFHFFAENSAEASWVADYIADEFPDFQVVVCSDINCEGRYCLDILPATKVTAVEYLFEGEFGIVAGDSGNDADMIINSNSNLNGVVVGGAKPELLEAIRNVNGKGNHAGNVLTISGKRGEKQCYVESNPGLLGPESIREALEIFL